MFSDIPLTDISHQPVVTPGWKSFRLLMQIYIIIIRRQHAQAHTHLDISGDFSKTAREAQLSLKI